MHSMIFPPMNAQLRLGLGGAALGNLFSAISDAQAHDLLTDALHSGCQTFDTAPHYGNGLSEHRMGRALRSAAPGSFVLSSKVGRILLPHAQAPRAQNSYEDVLPYVQRWDYSAAGVRRSIENSLQRLGLARLDVAYVHDCDALTHGARYQEVLAQVVHEALPELRRMQGEGLVRHIGLGVNDVQVCLDVLLQADVDCLLLAGRYSLIDHSALPRLLPLCTQKGVRIALGGVFNSGILATGVRGGDAVRFNYEAAPAAWVARVQAVQTVCQTFDVPLRAAALQFPLAHPAVDIVLLGARDSAEWRDGMAMLRHPIPLAFWQTLQHKGLLPPNAPLPQE